MTERTYPRWLIGWDNLWRRVDEAGNINATIAPMRAGVYQIRRGDNRNFVVECGSIDEAKAVAEVACRMET